MGLPSAFTILLKCALAGWDRLTSRARAVRPARAILAGLLLAAAAAGPALAQTPDKVTPPPTSISFKYLINPWVVGVNTLAVDLPELPSILPPKAAVFTSNPPLPSGLSLDNLGLITGKPKVPSPPTRYTISFTSPKVIGSATLSITVLAPPAIAYPDGGTLSAPAGSAIPPFAPTDTGGAVAHWSISPALGNGLSFSTSTGIITGTPVNAGTTQYTVTGTNVAGSSKANLTVTITPAGTQLPAFSYNGGSDTLTIAPGASVSFAPTVTAGAPLSYNSITGTLPPGLSFALGSGTGAGTISGTVTGPGGFTSTVTVTGANTAGSTDVTVTIHVKAAAPNISYPTNNPQTGIVGTAIASITPVNTGGQVTTWSVNPALPAGLNLDTTFTITSAGGTIYGTPTAPTPNYPGPTVYTVTASNATLPSSTATVSLTISPNLAPAFSYPNGNTLTGTLGKAVSYTPTSTGGAVPAGGWASVPAKLPAGLSFDPNTGIISGTPTALIPASPATTVQVTATNAGGSASVTVTLVVNDLAPSGLTYAPISAATNVAISNDTPTISGGAVTLWTVNPPLPAKLTLSSAGVISGTPTAPQSATSYTVTASNSGGSTTGTVSITVTTPPAFSYPTGNTLTGTLGASVGSFTPTSTGGPVPAGGWASVPATLPAGLSFDPNTGIISGTPTALIPASPATTVQVTATNAGGSASVTVTLVVNDVAPSGLTYAPISAATNVAISNDTPSISGGAVTLWTVNPPLPAKLTLSSAGVISGTPTAPQGTTSYTVTASNSGGSTTGTVSITVTTPPAFSYPNSNTLTGTLGASVGSYTPTSTGGPVPAGGWASVPATLPAGLSFDPNTGIISGTPTALIPASPATTVQVTATNAGGSASVTVTLVVNDLAPTGLSYTASPLNGIQNKALSDAPIVTPASVQDLTWTVTVPGSATPLALPAGLSLDASGNLTGTPTMLQAATPYQINTTNSAGTASVTLDISVAEAGLYQGIFTNNNDVMPNPGRATLTSLDNGKVLIAGGRDEATGTPTATLTLFDPATKQFTASKAALPQPVEGHTATLLADGKVFIAGGFTTVTNGDGTVSSVVTGAWSVYDPGGDQLTASGTLADARAYHTATRLPTGTVLLAGGQGSSGTLQSTEIYDPAANTLIAGPSLNTARQFHTATLLPHISPQTIDLVLVAGGNQGSPLSDQNTFETLDLSSSSNPWVPGTTTLNFARSAHAAPYFASFPSGSDVTANYGAVVLVGGTFDSLSIEVYAPTVASFSSNPQNVAWTTYGNAELTAKRDMALVVTSGRELWQLGGQAYFSPPIYVNTAEVLDIFANGNFFGAQGLSSMPPASDRAGLPAVQIGSDPTLLVTSGLNSGGSFADALTYDNGTGLWSNVGPAVPRLQHTATVLDNGQVFYAMGETDDAFYTGSSNCQLYDPVQNTWTTTSPPGEARLQAQAASLNDATHRAVVVGGYVNGTVSGTGELYDYTHDAWSAPFSLVADPLNQPTARVEHTVTNVADGEILVGGGTLGDGQTFLSSFDLITYGLSSIPSAITAFDCPVARAGHTATVSTATQQLVVAGGQNLDSTQSPPALQALKDVEVLELTSVLNVSNPTPSWSSATLQVARYQHTATALQNGNILVVGGTGGSSTPGQLALASAEILTPDTSQSPATWSSTQLLTMPYARQNHTATLLDDGRVLITGGTDQNGQLVATSLIYDPNQPAGSAFTPVTPGSDLRSPRSGHTAVPVLVNGVHQVMILGGEPLQANPEFFQ